MDLLHRQLLATCLVQDSERVRERDRAVINLTATDPLCRQGPCDSEQNLKICVSHGCLRFQGQCVE